MFYSGKDPKHYPSLYRGNRRLYGVEHFLIKFSMKEVKSKVKKSPVPRPDEDDDTDYAEFENFDESVEDIYEVQEEEEERWSPERCEISSMFWDTVFQYGTTSPPPQPPQKGQ